MPGRPIEEQTDTHLSKRYNDALFDCIMKCNMSGYINEATPHYEHLLAYIAAVDVFFINTYFLFVNTIIKGIPLANQLVEKMNEIRQYREDMKMEPKKRTTHDFHVITAKCRGVHMMIMFGLQRRNMLVRMSDREPRGEDSINYWDDKAAFKKGGVPMHLEGKNDKKDIDKHGPIRDRITGWGRIN
jgi:hypothetical protein